MKWWCPHCKEVMPVYIERNETDTHHLYYYNCGDCHTIIGKFRKKRLSNYPYNIFERYTLMQRYDETDKQFRKRVVKEYTKNRKKKLTNEKQNINTGPSGDR